MMMQKVKDKTLYKVIYKGTKSQLSIDKTPWYGEQTLNLNFQFLRSSGDRLVLSKNHIKKLKQYCKKILSSKKGTKSEKCATKGSIFAKKNSMILGCACLGGISSHLLVMEKLKDGEVTEYQIVLHSGCKYKIKKQGKYRECDEIILDKKQIKQLLGFMI